MRRVNHCFLGASAFSKRTFILSILAVMFFICLTTAAPAKFSSESQSQPVFQVVPVDECPFFEDDLHFDHLEEAIRGSLVYYQKLPSEKRFFFGKDTFLASHLIRSLKRFLAFIENKPSSKKLNAFIDQNYQVYAYMQTVFIANHL